MKRARVIPFLDPKTNALQRSPMRALLRKTYKARLSVRTQFPNMTQYTPVNQITRWYLDIRNSCLEKLIFTATTGRSGTMSLTFLLSLIPGCRAFHEPSPIMNGRWLHAASYGQMDQVQRYYRRAKSIQIRRAAIGARYYAEVNHLFIKTFIEHAVRDFGKRVEVIHLIRPAIEVAKSIYYLQHWPGTQEGNNWWLDYRAPSNLIQVPDLLDGHTELSHPFYKALWYWYEMEARTMFWRRKLTHIRFHDFETGWLNEHERIFNLLDDLDIEYDKEILMDAVGTRKNTKEQKEQRNLLNRSHHENSSQLMREGLLDQQHAVQMNDQFRNILVRRGLWPTPSKTISALRN